MSDQPTTAAKATASLLSEFEEVSREKWFLKVMDELKGKDFDKTLNWHPFENATIFPIYTAQDLQSKNYLLPYQHSAGNRNHPELGARKWNYLEKIDVEDFRSANKRALEALNSGADGILFQLKDMISFDAISALLNEIKPQYAEISFAIPATAALQMLAMYRSYLMEHEIGFSGIRGKIFIDLDSIGPVTFRELVKISVDLPHFKVVAIEEAAEGSEPERLGKMLAKWHGVIDLLTDEEVDEGTIAMKCFFSLKATNNYFLEIARLRALRFLLTEWLSFYGVEESPDRWEIHVQTSLNPAETDANNHLLSNAGQAMSSIVGGANSVVIKPHLNDANKRNFANRIARNISNLLREETYLDKVSDPAAGSYFIENLTEKLAEAAWKEYQKEIS